MKLGLHLTRFNWPEGETGIGSRVASVARRSEEAGFNTLTVMDHYFQIGLIGPPEEAMLEAYDTLSFIAEATSRIRLGTLVTGVTYRHPGLLVKSVTTLDVLSGGRAFLGIGAAWFEQEHLGLGAPYPLLKERFERLEETLQIAHHMWSGSTAPYNGKHYQLTEPILSPPQVQRPHPPMVIGGGGEKRTLRLVAQYADACNLFDQPALADKLAILRGHCETVGRDYSTVRLTATIELPVSMGGEDGTIGVNEAINRLGRFAELGFDEVHVMPRQPLEHSTIDLFGNEIVPAVSNLAVAAH